jgi:hypothetical protein
MMRKKSSTDTTLFLSIFDLPLVESVGVEPVDAES